MIELPDDELDKLFRKSSEELEPQYDPDDWSALKGRLDEHDGKTLGGWLRKWWPAGLLVLLIPVGLLVYFSLQKPEKTSAEKPVVNQSQEPAVNQLPMPEPAANAGSSEKTDSTGQKSEETVASRPAGGNPEVSTGKPLTSVNEISTGHAPAAKSKILPRGQSKAGGVYLEPNRSKRGGGDGAFFNLGESGGRRKGGRENGGRREELFGESGGRKKGGSGALDGVVEREVVFGEVAREERMVIAVNALRARPLVWEKQGAAVEIKPVEGQAQDPEADKQERPAGISPKMAVRIGYSPDLTTVGFKNFTRVGKAFSLLFEYGVTRRLYLQTGIVRSEKDYAAGAGEYEFYDYVTSINTPDEVDGVCSMYELPFGLRYDLAQKANARWFAGVGFSSYYVQKEKYVYHYKDYVHGQKPGWQGKTGLFLFSHLNASVGYERSITRRLSILAEPYVRIPLKGVGYGKVNLLTTGAWISLRYTPVFR